MVAEMTAGSVWTNYMHLATSALRSGRKDLCMELLTAAVEEAKSLGDENAQHNATFRRLLAAYVEGGKFKSAHSLCRKQLRDLETVLGKNHLQVARVLEAWADAYLLEDKHHHAYPLLKRACLIYSAELKDDDPHMTACKTRLAFLSNTTGPADG